MKEVTVKVGAINKYTKGVIVPVPFKDRLKLLFQGLINIEVETVDTFHKQATPRSETVKKWNEQRDKKKGGKK